MNFNLFYSRLLKIRIDQSKLSSITSTSKTVFRKITEDMHNNVPESLGNNKYNNVEYHNSLKC